jgi:chemotaxis protein methyltransferase CheR
MQWTHADREFAYTADDFAAVAALLYQLAGIRLNVSKDAMVYSRLVRRIRTLQLSGVREYLDYLRHTPEENEHFINALTTNLTSFFREAHHFDVLAEFLQRQRCSRIWCAASSTGEEPYSIAMVVAEHYGRFDVPVEIIATDIDSQVLKEAQTGIYNAMKVERLEPERLRNFFQRGAGSKQGKVRVCAELRQMVQFERLNLLDPHWQIPSGLDVIFCRNVMIYFDKQTQLQLLERMIRLLRPGGIYIAGHSENFSHARHLVEPIGRTVYRPSKPGERSGV